MRSSNQKERLQKLKQGEGTFVYQGGACDTEAVPGLPMLGKDGNQMRSVIFKTVETEDGSKVQVVDPDSSEKGELVWKRAPKFTRIPIETYKLRAPGVVAEHTEDGDKYGEKKPSLTAKPSADGSVKALYLEFPKGQPVCVGSPQVALKLRCLPFFKEVEGAPSEAAPKASGKKGKAEATAEG